VQRSLERPAEQVFLNRQANSNPAPSPYFRTTRSHEGNPASLDQLQIGAAPNPTMPSRAHDGDQPRTPPRGGPGEHIRRGTRGVPDLHLRRAPPRPPCHVTSHPRHRHRLVTPPAQTHPAAGHAPDREPSKHPILPDESAYIARLFYGLSRSNIQSRFMASGAHKLSDRPSQTLSLVACYQSPQRPS
jgi:hypothetical protein